MLYADLVLYEGPPRVIDFRKLEEAGAVFTLCIQPRGSTVRPLAPRLVRHADGWLEVTAAEQHEYVTADAQDNGHKQAEREAGLWLRLRPDLPAFREGSGG